MGAIASSRIRSKLILHYLIYSIKTNPWSEFYGFVCLVSETVIWKQRGEAGKAGKASETAETGFPCFTNSYPERVEGFPVSPNFLQPLQCKINQPLLGLRIRRMKPVEWRVRPYLLVHTAGI